MRTFRWLADPSQSLSLQTLCSPLAAAHLSPRGLKAASEAFSLFDGLGEDAAGAGFF